MSTSKESREAVRTYNFTCCECRHTFDEPVDENGNGPSPTQRVVCPGCNIPAIANYYIKSANREIIEHSEQ